MMLWRDGDSLILQDGNNRFDVYLSMTEDPEPEFHRWIDGYNFRVREQHRQSFLLDYTSYLIESGIDNNLGLGGDSDMT